MPPRSSTASYAGSELPRDTIEVDLPSKASNDNLRNLTTAIEVSEDLGDRAENKQKRKRTRYVYLYISPRPLQLS